MNSLDDKTTAVKARVTINDKKCFCFFFIYFGVNSGTINRSVSSTVVDLVGESHTALAGTQPNYNRWIDCKHCYNFDTRLVSIFIAFLLHLLSLICCFMLGISLVLRHHRHHCWLRFVLLLNEALRRAITSMKLKVVDLIMTMVQLPRYRKIELISKT